MGNGRMKVVVKRIEVPRRTPIELLSAQQVRQRRGVRTHFDLRPVPGLAAFAIGCAILAGTIFTDLSYIDLVREWHARGERETMYGIYTLGLVTLSPILVCINIGLGALAFRCFSITFGWRRGRR